MLKTLTIIFGALLLMACNPETKVEPVQTEYYDDRSSLPILFETEFEELDPLLSDNDFYVHAKSIEYALNTAKDGTVVAWTGPQEILKGKVVLMVTIDNEGNMCKNFTQSITIGEKTYIGKGTACKVSTTWTVQKLIKQNVPLTTP